MCVSRQARFAESSAVPPAVSAFGFRRPFRKKRARARVRTHCCVFRATFTMAFSTSSLQATARPSLRRSVRAAKVAPTASLRKVSAAARVPGLPLQPRRTRAEHLPQRPLPPCAPPS